MILMILLIINLSGVTAHPSDSFNKTLAGIQNHSTSIVEVYLNHRGSDSGVLQIVLPNRATTKHLCYPETFLQQQEAAKFLHVLCRQLGFVTFGTRYKEIFETDHLGILSTSSGCTGRETVVAQCPWQDIKTQLCRKVMGTRCSSCYNKITAMNGTVHNPGFPHTYLYSTVCDWTIQVPEERGILLTFDQFALPLHKEFECESHLELAYSYQKLQKNRRICPLDLPENIRIPSNIVRIRFSSGTFRQEYEKQQTHYGFNIVFRGIKLEVPNNISLKIILITLILASVVIVCACCYCCRLNFVLLRKRNARTTEIPQENVDLPNRQPPTREQLQEAIEFMECATKKLDENKNEGQTMNFTIFQSESSSTNSVITRWRSHTDLPVTSALAPLGPDHRVVSIAMTPRSVFPESPRMWSEECVKRIEQVRTKLVARFSTSSSHNQSDISLFFPANERRSYSKLSCEEELPLKKVGSSQKSVSLDQSTVPSIVIEFVE